MLFWEDDSYPLLVVVRSAGFLAEVYIQYHEHAGKLNDADSCDVADVLLYLSCH